MLTMPTRYVEMPPLAEDDFQRVIHLMTEAYAQEEIWLEESHWLCQQDRRIIAYLKSHAAMQVVA